MAVKIGLALGSGSSRGWSHIGVINALRENGIVPDIVCGTSVGALVGASYLAGNLDRLEQWASSLTRFKTSRYFKINYSLTGFVHTDRFHEFLCDHVAPAETEIESLSKRYGAVATELTSGREIWFTKGSVLEAVWASISLPGLFPAIRHQDQWLVDGGLVNPVPVSLCRALGADIVIAINLNGDIMKRRTNAARRAQQKRLQESDVAQIDVEETKSKPGVVGKLSSMVADYRASVISSAKSLSQPPGLFEAIVSSVNITQDRITRSRMAGDPPRHPDLAQVVANRIAGVLSRQGGH